MSKRVQSHEHPSIVELLGDKIYLRKNVVLVPATEDRGEYYEYDENTVYSPTRDIEYIEEHFDFYWDKAEGVQCSSERTWRDGELAWYDNYQKNSRWDTLGCVDQELLYRYHIALLQYPQQPGFPNSARPTRPALSCDIAKTDEQRWESDAQLELNARRLSALTINNALVGVSGSEVSATLLIAPTVSCISNMGAYVTESVINGLVDVLWDTDGGGQVKLTVQNLKPVFKACESYISELYKSKKNIVDAFGSPVVITDDANWPPKTIALP